MSKISALMTPLRIVVATVLVLLVGAVVTLSVLLSQSHNENAEVAADLKNARADNRDLRSDLRLTEDQLESVSDERDQALDVAERAEEQAQALEDREKAVSDREAAVTATEQQIARNSVEQGTWTVGRDIEPGTYRTKDAVIGQCYWEITAGGTNGSDIIDNDIVSGGFPTVSLSAGQVFTNSRCGTFVKQ
ncbi:hypothetical protein SAMN05660748_0412 [Blastococcus aggregatus]|uniref:Uncharacterized protein n=1 Tax=Blastococcus aggregatus TaxID=38502 RepID=A0A285V124_9ACTN|nr:hypothetical protein [Blastococcus aggregatus]SOC46716.1 hypothetical protein SAMN05660748_0412 [Blastococcus aggregatus]